MAVTVYVTDKSAEALERALKKFKNKVKKANVLLDLKRAEYFMKPSIRKRQRMLKSIAKQRRETEIEKQKSQL